MNYYERHLGDFVRDTAHLSMLEDGAYNRLLDRYYATEAGIPDAQKYRVARAHTKEEKQAVDTVLGEFFFLADGVWTKNRVEKEIAKAQGRIKAAQDNGKRGGRPKKEAFGSENETQKKPDGFPLGSENETQKKAHQTPDTSLQIPVIEQAAVTTGSSAAALHERAIELTAMLRKRGAALQASDPNVQAWAAGGVTDAEALTALEIAQQRRQQQASVQPVNSGLLNAIISDQRSKPAGKSAQKFDPVAYVNKNRTQQEEGNEQPGKIIDITP